MSTKQINPAENLGRLGQAASYAKGDLRRTLVVLGAIDENKGATLVQIARRTGLDNRSVIHLIEKSQIEAGVVIRKDGPVYILVDLGPVFKPSALKSALIGA